MRRAHHDDASLTIAGSASEIPVAVIGIGCRFPGGIDSADALWRALAEGRDLVTEVPPQRWDADAIHDPEPGVPGRPASRRGAFADDVAGFEPAFFGLTEHEAERMDPQARLLLETACEALEHAGLPPHGLRGSATGVFAGHTHGDHLALPDRDEPARSSVTGRISYLLGLRGPSLTLDSSDSSSLVAVHLGCQALRTGEADLALAGGDGWLDAFTAYARARGVPVQGINGAPPGVADRIALIDLVLRHDRAQTGHLPRNAFLGERARSIPFFDLR